MHPKIDIEEGNPQKLPSPGGRGLRGGDKKGDNTPSPHAPHRVHDCPEPDMVEGQPSPLPSPKRLRAGRHQGRGRTGSSQSLLLSMQIPLDGKS